MSCQRHATRRGCRVPILGLTAVLVAATWASTARAEEEVQTNRGVSADLTRNPVSVEAETRQINTSRQPHVPLRGADRLFQPWYGLKARLADRIGLRFGIAYTPLYQTATSSLTGEDQAAGAIFEVVGTWDLVCRQGRFPGGLGFRVEHRHRLWTDVAPQFLFQEVGSGLPTALGYSQFDWSVAELWWEQQLVKDRFSVRLGKMNPFGYHDFFPFKNPKTAFTNAAIALNPTIAWPQFGLGVTAEVRPRRDVYLSGGLHDANGTPTRSGLDTFFEDQEYFVIGEVGWDPGFLSDGGGKNPAAPDLHMTAWHTDARTKAGRPEGWGLGFTGQWPCGNLVPFLRYGYSNGGAAPIRHLAMGGVAWASAFGYEQDTVGVAFAWGQPSNRSLRSQGSAEIYYKMQFTRRLAITPMAQVLVHPSLAPDEPILGIFGLRARLDF